MRAVGAQMMCLRNDVPLARQRLTRPRNDTFDDSRAFQGDSRRVASKIR